MSLPTCTHMARNPCESVPGVSFRLPPGTESLRKRSRCPFLPSTCHGIPAKVFQVSLPAVHLARKSRESVSGVFPRCPPATVFPRKCSRCLFPPSTCHGIPAKVFQVSHPAAHLARNSRESVPGVLSCRPPATESLRKCSRCLFPPSTCHGIPAKVFQVSLPAVHLPRKSLQKCTRCPFPPPTWHGIPAKVYQVSFPAAHLARNPRKSVSGSTSCLPPGTVSTQKCTRCPFPPPTWHGIHAKVYQVSFSASHLARNSRESVPGVTSCLPPATESLRKCSRCPIPLPTWHGIPAKACQVSLPAAHLLRYPHESVSGGFPCLPPGTESLQKRSRCLIPSPPGTEIPQKRSRWHVPPSTWHSFPAKACQVSHPAFHLPRKSRKSVSGVPSRLPPGTEIPRKRVR